MLIEDGFRYTYSISDKNFSIVEVYTNDTIIYNGTRFVTLGCNINSVRKHLVALIDLIINTRRRLCFLPNIFEYKFSIQEAGQNTCTLITKHGKQRISDRTKTLKFSTPSEICNGLNYILSRLLQAKNPLNPRRNIVRLISDVGVLVWVHGGNSLVCYTKNIQGVTMHSALFNGVFYPLLFVSVNESDSATYLFDSVLNLIATFPIDDSIRVYYKDEQGAFNE